MKPITNEESVQTLMCSVIKLAVEDYRYCVSRGYISGGEIIASSVRGKYLIGLNLRSSDLPALLQFIWCGGLHKACDAARLSLPPSRILSALEPEKWKELLKERCPSCDTGD